MWMRIVQVAVVGGSFIVVGCFCYKIYFSTASRQSVSNKETDSQTTELNHECSDIPSRNADTFRIRSVHDEQPNEKYSNNVSEGVEVNKEKNDCRSWTEVFDSTEYKDISSHYIPSQAAYVTLAITDDTAQQVIHLIRDLLNTKTRHHIIVMVGPYVTDDKREMFLQLGAKGVEIEFLDIRNPRISLLCAKFQAWQLIDYARCIFIAPGCKVQQNLDHLFRSKDEICSIPLEADQAEFDPRLFVYTPSITTYEQLLDHLIHKGCEGGERKVLNAHFSSWKNLHQCNALRKPTSPLVVSKDGKSLL